MVGQESPDQGMTPKERMFRALTGQRPDVLAAAPAYPGLFLADFERAFYIEQYRLRLHECGSDRYPVDHEEDTLFRARAIFQSYGIFKARPDWIEAYRGASRAWARRTDIVECQGHLYYEDRASGKRVAMQRARLPRGNAEMTEANPSETDIWDLSGEIHDSDDVAQIIPIRRASELLESGEMDLLRRIVHDYGDRYFISSILDTPFSYVSDQLGFYGLMVTQHDRPRLLHSMLERQLAQTQERMAALASVGVHGVYVEEVFTGADLISPRAYDEFVFTYNVPYFRHMRGLGLLPIHYVCGDVLPRLEQMARCDVAAIAVEESKKNFCIEIEEVVRRVGDRVAVLGNIDAVHFGLHATLDEMAAEVRRQAGIGARARGFVVSTGSPFPLDTNPRLIDRLVTTAHSLPG
jgi:hypothetical protein